MNMMNTERMQSEQPTKGIEIMQIEKKILIVDDDVTFLKIIKKWLMGKYQVTLVKSGVQALQYLAGHKPDLILMDYDMPVNNGPQVLEMIRKEPDLADIPVIFLTGKEEQEIGSSMIGVRQKPQGYLLKSMSQDHIVASVDAYFAAASSQDSGMSCEIREDGTGK